MKKKPVLLRKKALQFFFYQMIEEFQLSYFKTSVGIQYNEKQYELTKIFKFSITGTEKKKEQGKDWRSKYLIFSPVHCPQQTLFFIRSTYPKKTKCNQSLTHVTEVQKRHRYIQATPHDFSASFKDMTSRKHLPFKKCKAT